MSPAYPLLDWLSYVEPFEGLDITPWNPQVGLSFPLVLLFGRRTIPFLLIAPLVSHLLLNFSPVDLEKKGIAHATVIGGGYSAAALFLMRPAHALRSRFAVNARPDLVDADGIGEQRLRCGWLRGNDDAFRLSGAAGLHRGHAELLGSAT